MLAKLLDECYFEELMDIYNSKIKYSPNYKISMMPELRLLLTSKKGQTLSNYGPISGPEIRVGNLTQSDLESLHRGYEEVIENQSFKVWPQYTKKNFFAYKYLKTELNTKVLHDFNLQIDSYIDNLEKREEGLFWKELPSRLAPLNLDKVERLDIGLMINQALIFPDADCVPSEDYKKFDLAEIKTEISWTMGRKILNSSTYEEFKKHQEVFKEKDLEVIFKHYRENSV